MSEIPGKEKAGAEESRFDLQQMLQEIAAEAQRKPDGPVAQSELTEMFRNRRKRDPDG